MNEQVIEKIINKENMKNVLRKVRGTIELEKSYNVY